jgi:tetratricopeptide (TPR) repeat protein
MGRIETLQRMIATKPEDPFPRYGLALELKSSGQLEEAERTFRELLLGFPEYAPAYLHAGNLLLQLQKRDDAEEVFRKGVEVCARKGDDHARSELLAALSGLQQNEDDEDQT